MNRLRLACGAFQSFVPSTIVRLDARCNHPFSGQPVSNRSVKPFWSHGPIQAYVALPDLGINNCWVSFGGCQGRYSTVPPSQLKPFRLCNLIQSLVVRQNLKPKKCNDNNRARARQVTMKSRRPRAVLQQFSYVQAHVKPRCRAPVESPRPSRSRECQATISHGRGRTIENLCLRASASPSDERRARPMDSTPHGRGQTIEYLYLRASASPSDERRARPIDSTPVVSHDVCHPLQPLNPCSVGCVEPASFGKPAPCEQPAPVE